METVYIVIYRNKRKYSLKNKTNKSIKNSIVYLQETSHTIPDDIANKILCTKFHNKSCQRLSKWWYKVLEVLQKLDHFHTRTWRQDKFNFIILKICTVKYFLLFITSCYERLWGRWTKDVGQIHLQYYLKCIFTKWRLFMLHFSKYLIALVCVTFRLSFSSPIVHSL